MKDGADRLALSYGTDRHDLVISLSNLISILSRRCQTSQVDGQYVTIYPPLFRTIECPFSPRCPAVFHDIRSRLGVWFTAAGQKTGLPHARTSIPLATTTSSTLCDGVSSAVLVFFARCAVSARTRSYLALAPAESVQALPITVSQNVV